jgi:hypothetical protein
VRVSGDRPIVRRFLPLREGGGKKAQNFIHVQYNTIQYSTAPS